MQRPLVATLIILLTLATLTACSDPTPALEIVATVSANADGRAGIDCPGFHRDHDGNTHGRAQGDAGQYSDSQTNGNSGAPRGTRSPPGTGLRGNVLRTIRR